MKHSPLTFLWVWVFGILAFVPLLFSGVIFTLTAFVEQSLGARIMLIAIGSLALIAFILSVVFVHAFVLGAARRYARKELTWLNTFKNVRGTYWRVFLFDILAVIIALPVVGLYLLTILEPAPWRWAVTAVLGLLHAYFLLHAPLLLHDAPAWRSVVKSAVDGWKRPGKRVLHLLGVAGWMLIPLLVWAFSTRLTLTQIPIDASVSQILGNALALLLGQQHAVWLYFASPASIWVRAGLLALNVAYLIAATVWLARRSSGH